ncbi:MAG: TraB/GumN family protein [Ruminococcus sp.]|nr:TraB/GumN family protein [Ruminococcus sp.]
MKTRKITAAVMAVAMTLSFVSCEKKDTANENNTSDKTAETTAVTEAAETTTVTESVETTEAAEEATVAEGEVDIEALFGATADINEFITTTDINPPLWKVTDPATGNTIHLLGTIHMLPASITEYPADIMEIYNNADSIAVEYDITAITTDANAQLEYVNGMIYSDGSTVKEHISAETYEKAKAYFESIGAYSEMLDQYTTGYWINQLTSVMLLRLENMQLSGTDAYFIGLAQEDGKEIINIEDLATQTGALNAYSDDYADYTISEVIDSMDDIDEFAESYAELYNGWAVGDGELDFDSDVDVDKLPEDIKDDHEAYVKLMLDDRNQNMAEKASQYLKEGKNCFYMVGAAHYSGENGVDNLLEGMGYTVEKVS